tara:strand:- start:3424 stop:5259 length:1836 start_codon:yes stop_codon:yes gene_type:complete
MIGEIINEFMGIFIKLITNVIKIAQKAWKLVVIILIIFSLSHFWQDIVIWWNTGVFPPLKQSFTGSREKLFNSNEFNTITLPDMNNYDIEMGIPSGQLLHNTVQGNWGISTDANNRGMTTGVYRDGYTADGAIFIGNSGKRYKRMLEQGPYVIKYSVREGKQLLGAIKALDVKIYVNEKLVHDIKGEGVSSGKLKVVGNNYNNFNKLADGIGRGRRNIDYIKFIPKCEKMKKKEGFMNFREGVSNMEDPVAVAKQKNAILTYFKKIKDIELNQGGDAMKKQEAINCSTCVLSQWGGFRYLMPLDWYRMHIDIIGGMKPTELADKYAPKFTANTLKKDKYYSGENNDKPGKNSAGRGRRARKKKNSEIQKELGTQRELSNILETAYSAIKQPSFVVVDPEPISQGSSDPIPEAAAPVPLPKPEDSEKPPTETDVNIEKSAIETAEIPDNITCPKNCMKPRTLNEFCEKDIIRMVVGGEDKFYRKCAHTCKDRSDKDYVNYDQSNDNNPYNWKRDGCRDTEAHCVSKCNRVLVEVDESGRDLHSMRNNYTRTKETKEYSKSRLFATKDTTNMFGAKDNRLGGSKTAYRTDYKPLNPNPSYGPINYDAIWDFKA